MTFHTSCYGSIFRMFQYGLPRLPRQTQTIITLVAPYGRACRDPQTDVTFTMVVAGKGGRLVGSHHTQSACVTPVCPPSRHCVAVATWHLQNMVLKLVTFLPRFVPCCLRVAWTPLRGLVNLCHTWVQVTRLVTGQLQSSSYTPPTPVGKGYTWIGEKMRGVQERGSEDRRGIVEGMRKMRGQSLAVKEREEWQKRDDLYLYL